MNASVADIALASLQMGYIPLWIEFGSKAAKASGWQHSTPSEESLRRVFTRPSNLGIRTGDVHADGTCLLAIDIDLDDAELIRAVEHAIGSTVPCKKGKKGLTWFVRCDEQLPRQKLHLYRGSAKRPAGDILCAGSQTVIPPSIHPDTNLPYWWVAGKPLQEVPYEQLPLYSRSLIDEIRGFCKDPDDPIYKLNDMTWRGVGGGGDTHDTCLAAGASMVSRGWSDEDIHSRIGRAKREACETAGMAYDWPQEQRTIQEWIDSARAKFGPSGKPAKVSHGSLADAFLEQGSDHIRYDRDLNCWFFFEDGCWLGRHDFRVLNAVERSLPIQLRNSQTVSGVEKSLRNRPALSVRQQDWDPEPSLINTPDGVVNLRTGVVRPAVPQDRMTRVTAVGPADSYAASLWAEKLVEWFGPDPLEQKYIQTLAGYFLTGETRDACLPMWLGPGGDGKSLIANTFRWLMSAYARTSTDTAFIEGRYSQHSEELAWLKGARLVLVNETSGSQPWHESRIKAVTGGEYISASYKQGHVFEFRPDFKLLVTGNEPPQLRSVGPEMRRRFHVYKFGRDVVNPDPHLGEKLRAEAGIILRWMIEGAVRYYAEGLKPSPAVLAANAEYFEANDLVQQWLNERCLVGEHLRVEGGSAYADFSDWCTQQGVRYPMTRQRLTAKLRGKGYESKTAAIAGHSNSVRCYIGFQVAPCRGVSGGPVF